MPSSPRISQPEDTPAQPENGSSKPDDQSQHLATMTTTTRRNANGSVSSVYSGNRIRYLKKEDGQPLWRKDIQFLFLQTVFQDETQVFTKASDGTTGHTFAEIYIDAMAKSSKCSQILKEKLLTDAPAAVHMAMICLLVNVGRMNTTLNFFPEMRARVRTYHPIPSLQAQQNQQAYKQLQDGPRLKSILKGATEDTEQPTTIEQIMTRSKPRTNPVNLIFVLSQFAPKISDTHFYPPRDFFDLFMKETLSSKSRARAFLWMIWWYLESDFSAEDSQNNPFGPGQRAENGIEAVPLKVPSFEVLTEEQAAQENVDTEEELAFGEAKRREREAIVANEMPPMATGPKRGQKTPLMEHQYNYRFRFSPFGSGSDSGRSSRGNSPSPEPPRRRPRLDRDGDRRMSSSPPYLAAASREGPVPLAPHPTVSHGSKVDSLLTEQLSGAESGPTYETKRRSTGRSRKAQDTQYPSIESASHVVPSGYSSSALQVSTSRNRQNPGQQAIELSRSERVNQALNIKMREVERVKRRFRNRRGPVVDAWWKARSLDSGWDSEDDEAGRVGGVDEVPPKRLAAARQDDTSMSEIAVDREIRELMNAGDLGDFTKDVAKAARKLARAIDGIALERPRLDKKKGRDFRQEVMESSELMRHYVTNHNDGMRERSGLGKDASSSIVILDDDQGETPKKKRTYRRKPGPAPKRPVLPDGEGNTLTPSGNTARQLSGKKRRALEAAVPGERGIPLEEYFGDAAKEAAGSEARRSVSSVTNSKAKADEDEEIDEMDRELLADVDPAAASSENGGALSEPEESAYQSGNAKKASERTPVRDNSKGRSTRTAWKGRASEVEDVTMKE